MKVSNCCGAKDRQMNVHGVEYSDLELCPACKEPCEFEEKEPDCFIEQWGTLNGKTSYNSRWDNEKTLKECMSVTAQNEMIKTHATFRVYLKK